MGRKKNSKLKKIKRSNAKPPKTIDDAGGERVCVTITVNEKINFTRSATLKSDGGKKKSTYKTSDGENIEHNRKRGSKSLAKDMIK